MDLLIIADDLSGAADCGIAFVRAGQRTVVALQPAGAGADAGGVILAIDADTRRLPRDEAASRTAAIYRAHQRPGQRLYKKIDSTLRGNWAAEVAALRPFGGTALVAPAHPALGRTVRGGNVYVGRQALADTDLWKLEHTDRPAAIGAQLHEAGLATETVDADALRDDPAGLSQRIQDLVVRGVDAVIIDAQAEHTLRTLAVATVHSPAPCFWVGSGGLAREIAALQSSPGALVGARLQPPAGPTLVLAGSLSAVTDLQCALLRETGAVRELVVPPSVLRQGLPHPDWKSLHARIGQHLADGADLLLRIGREQVLDPSEGAFLAAALAKLVGAHFGKAGAVIATGGETARAMLVEARIDGLELLVELEPGVAAGLPLHAHRPYIVTKAGGFGGERTLVEAWSRLRPALTTDTPE